MLNHCIYIFCSFYTFNFYIRISYSKHPEDPSVLGIRVIDDTRLELMFTQPVSIIKFMLASPNLVPFPAAAEKQDYWEMPSAQLFSGRYTVNQSLDQFPIVLKRNRYYNGKQPLTYSTVHIHRHHKKDDARELISKLREGSLDFILKLSPPGYISLYSLNCTIGFILCNNAK